MALPCAKRNSCSVPSAPPANDKVLPSYVRLDSASNVFAVPEPVTILLSALLFIVVWVIPVNKEPSPLKLVAVTTPVATIPLLAVITPSESTLVTSSYVRVPPIETLPVKVPVLAAI